MRPADYDSLKAYFMLRAARRVGMICAWRLIQAFGSAAAVFIQEPQELLAVEGMDPYKVRALQDKGLTRTAEEKLEGALKSGHKLLTPESPGYPQELKEIIDPPMVLFVQGEGKVPARSLAMVGTRLPSIHGIRNASVFAEGLARNGVCIVSGLARGIDTFSHEGALKAGGQTIAVLGSGLNKIYPSENRRLADRIADAGAVISEYDPDEEPQPHHFPMRNRILSAISQAVLIVEAPRKSGALITADLALEQGKDIFAIPGSIRQSQAEGCNHLIKDGAFCVTEPEDILHRLRWDNFKAHEEERNLEVNLDTQSQRLLKLLSTEGARTVDELSLMSGFTAPELLRRLTNLESQGLAMASPGQRWHRK